jgi:hypothetical protein
VGKLQRIALLAILGLVLLYAVDYVLLRVRGQALGSVDVQIMWAVKQKDNRIDYELGDTETRPCVHSLFPQMGYAPCWYLSRHKNQTITVGSIPRRFARTLEIVREFRCGPEIDLRQFSVAQRNSESRPARQECLLHVRSAILN